MARPGNWRELIARDGWRSAPARIMARTRRVGECIEWIAGRSKVGNVPQIRIFIDGHAWTETAPRVVWMFCRGEFVGSGVDIKRSCANRLCVRFDHLVKASTGQLVNEITRQRLSDGARSSPRALARRKLNPQQVAEIREARAAKLNLMPLAKRYGVTQAVIYGVANGYNYREPGVPRPPRHDSSGWRAVDKRRFNAEECDEMLSMIAGGESYNAVGGYFDCYSALVGCVVRGLYRDGGLEPESRPAKPRSVCGQCCLTADDCECPPRTVWARKCGGCGEYETGHDVRTCTEGR